MTDRQLYLLSPYRPPTSYPVTLNADEAAAWLNGYAALWHPAALRGAAGPPTPASAYDHDQPARGGLYAVPEGPTLFQPDDWPHRLTEAGAASFRATPDRRETFALMAEAVRTLGDPGPLLDAPPEAVRLFSGVGYGYLMLDTLFEAMGHDRLLDAAGFWADVSAAVEAAATGDAAGVRAKLADAANKLLVAREGAYSGTVYLLDWLALDPADLGAPLPLGHPASLLASAELLERLAAEQPGRFAELKAADLDLCVGAYRERDDALLPVESQLWNLRRARAAVKELFGREPAVFARRRSAYHPQLPSWLSQAGYRHALAVSFDGALVPSRYAAFVNWSGPDGKAIDAFARDPHKAGEAQTFFNLGYHLHQAIQHDSTPTLPLLHAGPPGAGYDDWQALSELAPVFGRWTTMSGYFADAHAGDYAGAASADDFFADYLDDRVTARHRPDPVSGFARHHRLRRRLDSALALAALYRSLTPEGPGEADDLRRLEALEDEAETRGPDVGPADVPDELAAKAEAAERVWADRLTARLQARSADDRPGLMVLNPCGFARRVAIELDDQPGPIPADGPVKASEWADGRAKLVVEVPGLGFAWVPRGTPGAPPPKARIKTAEGTTVRNEFFEADLDPATGGLRAFRDSRTRINRLGELLVFNPGSKMVAARTGVTHAGPALGEVTSEGHITDEHGTELAAFRQRLRAWVGRPALELRVEITPTHRPSGYPWHAYYGARFVWRDERAAVFRGTNGANGQSTYPRPVSPDYLEFRLGSERTFLFTGGLPFVQKNGRRMVDVVLVPEGETATAFDLLIAADREHPMPTAAGWAAPAPAVATAKGPPPVGASGWLAAVDLPSLLLTGLRPAGGRAVAARFVETAGFGGAAELRFARDPAKAWAVDLNGEPLHELALAGDAVPLEFSAGELIGVRAEWV
jgi:hypothetical protein